MAHIQQQQFCLSVRSKFPKYFFNSKVLDCGSLDINGSNKDLFINCHYTGIDIAHGNNVDIVSKIHEFNARDGMYDAICSTECFEHDKFYNLSLSNIVRMLRSGGLLFFSCATTGRPEHGTRATTPDNSPFTSLDNEWQDYYKNLTEEDIRNVLDVDKIFEEYHFSINEEIKDLYFCGIKK
jgi:SAM-dependent methyltransferase